MRPGSVNLTMLWPKSLALQARIEAAKQDKSRAVWVKELVAKEVARLQEKEAKRNAKQSV